MTTTTKGGGDGYLADVALLLEGTYPYVRGGVSSWVHQIIRGFPDLRFAVVFLGSRKDAYGPVQYELPPNLVHLEEHYLHAGQGRGRPATRAGDPGLFADAREMHGWFADPAAHPGGEAAFGRMLSHLSEGRLDRGEFLNSRRAWDMVTDMYRERSRDPSFVDYFWTVRGMHEPVWILADIARRLPPCRCYHSVSTGYAGFLGALLARRSGRRLILSEHGLYTKERKIDLFHGDWIKDNRGDLERDPAEPPYFRQLWIRFFERLGAMAYAAADPVVSLYEAIRARQIADGAAPERTLCVPNGIDVARFAPLRARQGEAPRPVLCLIGRVVPIKDVKTFIRAMRPVAARMPGVEGWIAGPTEEDPEYHRECLALAESLGLAGTVKFLGFRDVPALLPEIGVNVLSSVSEALPLVVLEGFAAGVPAVCTDVGSCRQLLEGRPGDPEDLALGAAGRVVGIGDPAALAAACLSLLGDPAAWRAARAAGIARVERYYAAGDMLGAYRGIYARALAAAGPAAGAGEG